MFTRVLLGILLVLPAISAAKPLDSLTFIFQKQKNPAAVQAEAELLGKQLEELVNLPVSTRVPSGYAAAVQALVSKTADLAYLDSVSYLLAKRDGQVEILLAEVRPDATGTPRTDYDSLILVPQDSPLGSINDLIQKSKDLHFVFTSPTSTSGYIMPYRRFVKEGLVQPATDIQGYFKKVNFAGSYAQAMDQVALGRGDACAVSFYAFEGPSAARYLPENVRNKLRVLARTPGVPTHVIAIRSDINSELKTKIQNALLNVSSENPKLLEDIYGTASFKKVDSEKHVQATSEALQYLNLPVERFMKK